MAQVRGTGKSTARGPGDGDRRGHSFLAGRHEYQPRRVFSTSGTDWQDRVVPLAGNPEARDPTRPRD